MEGFFHILGQFSYKVRPKRALCSDTKIKIIEWDVDLIRNFEEFGKIQIRKIF